MSAGRPPNVVVFFTDQQRWDTSGLHGNPLGLTANFDRMAREGTHVANSITCQPVCGPARSCFQTGEYATQTGCWKNGIALDPAKRTLAHHFNDAGYHTAYIGKWHLAPHRQEPVAPEFQGGYNEWLASNVLEFTSDAYQTRMYDNDGNPVDLPGYRVDAVTDAAIRMIDRQKDNPFFLFISYIEPHHQNSRDDYPAPDGYREEFAGRWTPPDLAALGGTTHRDLGGYYGMVKRLDEALGRLRDAIKSMGLEDDTVILFTSDHGCHFKTRNSEYKRSCHESSVRVPTAITGPGFMGGGTRPEVMSLIDLPPTILDAAGIAVPDSMMGNSILQRIQGKIDWPEEAFFQISESHTGRGIRTKRWKYAVSAPEEHEKGEGKSPVYEEAFLYDLESDPYELRNITGHGAYDDVRADLRDRLIKRMVAAGEDAPEIIAKG